MKLNLICGLLAAILAVGAVLSGVLRQPEVVLALAVLAALVSSGVFRLAPAVVAGACWSVGPAGGALVAGVAALSAALRGGAAQLGRDALEGLGAGVGGAVLAGTMARPELASWLGALLFVPLQLVRYAGQPLAAQQVLGQPLLAMLLALAPFSLLPVIAALALLWRQAVVQSQEPLEPADRRKLEWQLGKLVSSLDRQGQARDRARRDLASARTAYNQLEVLIGLVSVGTDLAATRERVLELAGPYDTLVLFEGSELAPTAFRGGPAERLASAELLRLGEPCVQACFESKRAVAAFGSERLLEDRHGLALPVEPEAVLYVGSRQPISSEQQDALSTLAGQAGLALEAARRLDRQHQALEREEQARRSRDEQARALEQLLVFTTALSQRLDLDDLPQQLGGLIPHQRGWLEASDRHLSWPDPAPLPNLEVSAPLILPELIAVPLEEGGALLLQAPSFKRKHLYLLQFVGLAVTAALARSRLHEEVRQAYAHLSESRRLAAVGELAAGVAHEINNPMAALALALEGALLKLRSQPELAERKLERAFEVVERVKAITGKLLFYARDAHLARPTQVNQVVQDTLEFLEPGLTRESIALERELSELPLVQTDPHGLHQVLTNLVLNARNALGQVPEDRRQLKVATRLEQERLLVQVSDTGPGIEPALQEKIFQPFFTTRPDGTGLGLSTSREIARSQGGELRLEPPSTFVLELPLK